LVTTETGRTIFVDRLKPTPDVCVGNIEIDTSTGISHTDCTVTTVTMLREVQNIGA
jgi:hypothetical protein